jgi:hypothetical protein
MRFLESLRLFWDHLCGRAPLCNLCGRPRYNGFRMADGSFRCVACVTERARKKPGERCCRHEREVYRRCE